ncbi:hypothetical protein ROZALSC1DRAFT_24357, partial [Rozella allomycis CSF55]
NVEKIEKKSVTEATSVDKLAEAVEKLTVMVMKNNEGKCEELKKDINDGLCDLKNNRIYFKDGDEVPSNFRKGGMMHLVRGRNGNDANIRSIVCEKPATFPRKDYEIMTIFDSKDEDLSEEEEESDEDYDKLVSAEKRAREEKVDLKAKNKIVTFDLKKNKQCDKKKTKLSSDVQEMCPGAKDVVKKILNEKLELTVGEVLSLSTPVRKQFENVIRTKRVEVPEVPVAKEVSVYVVTGGHTFEMILGKPFEIQAQAVVEHKEDGQVITTLTGPDGKKVQVSFNALPKERHRVADVRSINYATYNAKIVDSDIESDDTEFRYNNLKIKNLQTKRWTTLKIMGRRIPEQGMKRKHKKVGQKKGRLTMAIYLKKYMMILMLMKR